MNCPKCNGYIVEIIYGMPTSETFEKVKNKELYLGGCEVSYNQPKYHCYNCNIDIYKDLKNYIECYDYNQDEEESSVELSKEAIEQLARGIDPIDVKKYCEEHSEEYLEFLKETEGKTLDEVIGFDPFELTEEEQEMLKNTNDN